MSRLTREKKTTTLQKSKWLFYQYCGQFIWLSFPYYQVCFLAPWILSSSWTFLDLFVLLWIRYDSNASASDSSEDGDDSGDEGAKKKKEKKEKVVKEKKERKPRREVRGQRAWNREGPHYITQIQRLYNFTSWFPSSLQFIRKSRKTPADPRGRWVPTWFGWTPVVNESSQRIQESPSPRFQRRPERCGDNCKKRIKRWGWMARRVKVSSHTSYYILQEWQL